MTVVHRISCALGCEIYIDETKFEPRFGVYLKSPAHPGEPKLLDGSADDVGTARMTASAAALAFDAAVKLMKNRAGDLIEELFQ